MRRLALSLRPSLPLVAWLGLLAAGRAPVGGQEEPPPKMLSFHAGLKSYDPDQFSSLRYADQDPVKLASAFAERGFRVLVMHEGQSVGLRPTTPKKILGQLREHLGLPREGAAEPPPLGPRDIVVASFSGHGVQFKGDPPLELTGAPEAYFCPQDGRRDDRSTLLAMSAVYQVLKESGAGRCLLLVDACREEIVPPEVKEALKKTGATELPTAGLPPKHLPVGQTALFSCAERQSSWEDPNIRAGVYSYYVAKYVRGEAPNEYYDDEQYTHDGLKKYVEKHTHKHVLDLQSKLQTPVLVGNSQNWSFGSRPLPPLAITAVLTVREGDGSGPTVAGATVELHWRKAASAAWELLASGPSGADGVARLALTLPKERQRGEFAARVLRGETTKGATLGGFPATAAHEVYAAKMARPEPLGPGKHTAVFTVRQEKTLGSPPAGDVEIGLYWRKTLESKPVVLGTTRTNAQGKAEITGEVTLLQLTQGEFFAMVVRGDDFVPFALKDFPEVRNWPLYAPARTKVEPPPSGVIPVGKTAGEEWSGNGLKMKFRWCPAGSFTMGSPPSEKDRGGDEDQVPVTLTRGFWLKATEVTQGEWQSVMGTKPWSGKGDVKEGPNYAASYIAWQDSAGDDVATYLKKLNDQERKAGRLPAGWEYRLPTEAEWEYACRAGEKGAYCFGDGAGKLGEYGWFDENAWDVGEKYAHEVGLKKPNRWGLLDMHGNVWEWCADVYADKLPGGTDPLGSAASGSSRVYRGGCWYSSAWYCRSAYRYGYSPVLRYSYLGFRLALVQSR